MTLGQKIKKALPEKPNLKHIESSRNIYIHWSMVWTQINVDVTYANRFTIEYFINLLL